MVPGGPGVKAGHLPRGSYGWRMELREAEDTLA